MFGAEGYGSGFSVEGPTRPLGGSFDDRTNEAAAATITSTALAGIGRFDSGATFTVNHPLLTTRSVVVAQQDEVGTRLIRAIIVAAGQFQVSLNGTVSTDTFIRWAIVQL